MSENRSELRKALSGMVELKSREALRCNDAARRRTINDVFAAGR